MKHVVLTMIRFYQWFSRALVAQRFPLLAWTGCRQVPTCSEYCAQRVAEYGVRRGLRDGMARFLRCAPFVRASY